MLFKERPGNKAGLGRHLAGTMCAGPIRGGTEQPAANPGPTCRRQHEGKIHIAGSVYCDETDRLPFAFGDKSGQCGNPGFPAVKVDGFPGSGQPLCCVIGSAGAFVDCTEEDAPDGGVIVCGQWPDVDAGFRHPSGQGGPGPLVWNMQADRFP